MQLYIQEGNRKRKAEKATCLGCTKEFVRRKNPPKGKWIYCSKECADLASRKRIEVKCANCTEIFEKKPSQLKKSKSGLYFCSRRCKDEAQSLAGNCPQIRPEHFGKALGIYSYRLLMRDNLINGCQVCGEDISFKLTVHHIDGNRKNNKAENLEVVCFNCHATRHIRQNKKGDWVLDYKTLTSKEVVCKFDEEKMNNKS